MRDLWHFLTQATTVPIANALVRIRLVCCNSLQYGIATKYIDHLQKLRNYLCHTVTCVPFQPFFPQAQKVLHWLPVKRWIIFQLNVVTYMALRLSEPQDLPTTLVNGEKF